MQVPATYSNVRSSFSVIIIPHGFEPNYTLGFVKGLLANHIELVVISSDTDHPRLLRNGILSINLRGSQEKERSHWRKAVTLFRYYIRLAYYLLRNRGKIFHFTGLFRNELILWEGFFLCLICRVFSSRFLYTVHNVLPHNKENSKFFKWVYKNIYRFPHKLLVHTQLAKDQLMEQFSVPEEKVVVISIGLNEEVPDTNLKLPEARNRLGLPESGKVILFFGKADEYKGLDLLIEAFNLMEMSDLKLLISCWIPKESYRKKIYSLIASSKRKDDIILREGFVLNEEVEVYFKSADVLVLPYRHIYQSGVIFLGFRFGLPLVATDVGSIREFIHDDMGIITLENNAQGLASAITQFFLQQSKYDPYHIKKRGQKYHWATICQTLVPLYHRD